MSYENTIRISDVRHILDYLADRCRFTTNDKRKGGGLLTYYENPSFRKDNVNVATLFYGKILSKIVGDMEKTITNAVTASFVATGKTDFDFKRFGIRATAGFKSKLSPRFSKFIGELNALNSSFVNVNKTNFYNLLEQKGYDKGQVENLLIQNGLVMTGSDDTVASTFRIPFSYEGCDYDINDGIHVVYENPVSVAEALAIYYDYAGGVGAYDYIHGKWKREIKKLSGEKLEEAIDEGKFDTPEVEFSLDTKDYGTLLFSTRHGYDIAEGDPVKTVTVQMINPDGESCGSSAVEYDPKKPLKTIYDVMTVENGILSDADYDEFLYTRSPVNVGIKNDELTANITLTK